MAWTRKLQALKCPVACKGARQWKPFTGHIDALDFAYHLEEANPFIEVHFALETLGNQFVSLTFFSSLESQKSDKYDWAMTPNTSCLVWKTPWLGMGRSTSNESGVSKERRIQFTGLLTGKLMEEPWNLWSQPSKLEGCTLYHCLKIVQQASATRDS